MFSSGDKKIDSECAPSGYDQIITDTKQIYLENFHNEPEQAAIYKGIHFTCNEQTLYGICVTPQCEMGKKRVLFHTICQLIPFYFILESQLKKNGFKTEEISLEIGKEKVSKKKTEKFVNKFKEQFLENKTHRYYFLPGNDKIEHSFVDFQVIECIKHEDLKKMEKLAVLKPPWKEQLPTKYAFYQARIGTPRLSENAIKGILKSASLPLLDWVYD